MLISKRSPRNRGAFESRFTRGSSEFPLRQYLACREELVSSIVHLILLLAFLGTLVYFGFTLHRVFALGTLHRPALPRPIGIGQFPEPHGAGIVGRHQARSLAGVSQIRDSPAMSGQFLRCRQVVTGQQIDALPGRAGQLPSIRRDPDSSCKALHIRIGFSPALL